MSRMQVTLLAVFGALAGALVLGYLVVYISPYGADGQLSVSAVLLFFAALFGLTAGAGALVALRMHRRWPALAGRRSRSRPFEVPPADPALRQGILLGISVATLAALSILRLLDVTFALVTLILAGLIEAYAQTRT